MSDRKAIIAEICSWDEEARRDLIETVAASLSEEDFSEEEIAEFERRAEEVRSGKVKAIPGEDVRKSVQDLLAELRNR